MSKKKVSNIKPNLVLSQNSSTNPSLNLIFNYKVLITLIKKKYFNIFIKYTHILENSNKSNFKLHEIKNILWKWYFFKYIKFEGSSH